MKDGMHRTVRVGVQTVGVGWALLLVQAIAVAQSPPSAPEVAQPPASPPSATTDQPADESFSRYEENLRRGLAANPDIDPQRLLHHIPDPERARRDAVQAIESGSEAQKKFYQRLLERIDSIRRPQRVHLRLEDALRRALASSFAIEVARFNPAIETTRIVEAQAAFDAVFFSNLTKQIQDRPSGSQLAATDFDLFNWDSGVRKLLPTGMTVSTSYGLRRTSTSLAFQQLNPEYFNNLDFSFRQPLLRGFGLDFNQSAIRIAGNNQRVSELQFQVDVRELLRRVEEAYWQLTVARRDLVITAHLLEEFEDVYQYLVARQEFDVNKIQIQDTLANLETSRADFISKQAAVRNAEDRLLALINDPELNLADEVEIFPEDLGTIAPVTVDRMGELQAALQNRPEIRQSQLRVKNAAIAVGQAANLTLPRLDLSFSYVVDGLGVGADDAFDQLTMHDFTEYTVGVELEVPIGNRAGKAVEYRARLTQAQAQAALRQTIENVILEVNLALRQLNTSYAQIGPRFESVEAGERQVDSILARAERKDFTQLSAELGARRSLASNRQLLLQAIVNYNLALVDLERAKGTLLRYNNVVLELDGDGDAGR